MSTLKSTIDWLESHPGQDPPGDFDLELLSQAYTERPDLVPAPRLSFEDVLAGVTTGPLATKNPPVVAPAARRPRRWIAAVAVAAAAMLAVTVGLNQEPTVDPAADVPDTTAVVPTAPLGAVITPVREAESAPEPAPPRPRMARPKPKPAPIARKAKQHAPELEMMEDLAKPMPAEADEAAEALQSLGYMDAAY